MQLEHTRENATMSCQDVNRILKFRWCWGTLSSSLSEKQRVFLFPHFKDIKT